MVKESSLTSGSAAAAGSNNLKKSDYYIKESKPKKDRPAFIVDFDEDEVPDLE